MITPLAGRRPVLVARETDPATVSLDQVRGVLRDGPAAP